MGKVLHASINPAQRLSGIHLFHGDFGRRNLMGKKLGIEKKELLHCILLIFSDRMVK